MIEVVYSKIIVRVEVNYKNGVKPIDLRRLNWIDEEMKKKALEIEKTLSVLTFVDE